MTSQRSMENGQWHIKENQYRKIKIPGTDLLRNKSRNTEFPSPGEGLGEGGHLCSSPWQRASMKVLILPPASLKSM